MSEALTPSPEPTPAVVEPPAPSGATTDSLISSSQAEVQPAAEGEVKAPETEVEAKPEAKAPEKYEFKLPEGVEPGESLTKFEEIARAHNLSQEAAQGLLDQHLEVTKAQADAFAKAQTETWAATTEAWKQEVVKAFPGEKLTQAQVAVGKLIDEYGSPEVRQAFDFTGAGNNPHIFSFVSKIATALSEGTLVPGGTPPGPKNKSLGELLYGTTQG